MEERKVEMTYNVCSPEFEDAYIITETMPNKIMKSKNNEVYSLGIVTATVFVEETYALVDDEVKVLDSRLLSKAEVEEIGEENFEVLSSPAKSEFQRTAAVNSRGKLTISFSGSYSYEGSNGVKCDLTGIGEWSGFDLSSTNGPSTLEDYMGIVWGGDFQTYAISSNIQWNMPANSSFPQIRLVKSEPMKGVVWGFEELWTGIGAQQAFAKKITTNATIKKNNMTGGGNRTEATLQYTHVYGSLAGSVSISVGGGGFSVQNVDKSWSIACIVSNIPY